MKSKIFFITIVIFNISKPLFGQSVPETAFYWENPYSINPASVNFDYTAFFTISGRKQWTGIKGAPSTYFATGTFYSEDYRTQGGIKIGIACQNLFSFFQEEDNIFEGTGFFYARYRTRYLGRSYETGRYRTISIPRSCDIEAGGCIKQYQSNLQADGMLSLYINRETQEERFQFSLFGRTTGEIGILAGLKLISDIKFLCTYDYNLQALQKYSHGIFEVMVSFPVHRKRMGKCLYL